MKGDKPIDNVFFKNTRIIMEDKDLKHDDEFINNLEEEIMDYFNKTSLFNRVKHLKIEYKNEVLRLEFDVDIPWMYTKEKLKIYDKRLYEELNQLSNWFETFKNLKLK